MTKKILIANRGAIACRIIRTLKKMGIASVAVYSEADAASLHVTMADEAVCIGPAPAAQSYLQIDKILEAAQQCGAVAIHPGYGFLSENAEFADRCEAMGIAFLGPTSAQMRVFGLKHTARALAQQYAVPLLPGTDLLESMEAALAAADYIGYPVMLKSSAGGGGIGMQMCGSATELQAAFESVKRMAKNNFANAGVFLERYIAAARHIEVQIFGDGKGKVLSLGERDCSLQRRHQKVVEETPAPNLPEAVRQALQQTAVTLMQAVQYRSAGTVEFVVDARTNQFYFLEVNTRLQVEHGVTEAVTGVDLVEWMVRLPAVASEGLPDLASLTVASHGHAIQARVYAEDPAKQFRPATGLLTEVIFPDATLPVRVDTWVERGTEVTAYYDPMLAKIIVHAPDRDQALTQLHQALQQTSLRGFENNLAYLRALQDCMPFQEGVHTTRSLSEFHPVAATVDVLEAGVQTSIQDWPGRLGYWHVGVPPSGPMDAYAMRIANRLVGNGQGAAALEITLAGPTLVWNVPRVIALTGADFEAWLDEQPFPMWCPVWVKAGQTLRIKRTRDAGCRAYLAVQGGFDVPLYLGSQSTFALGQIGGHGGRVLRAGDVLHLAEGPPSVSPLSHNEVTPLTPQSLATLGLHQPTYSHHWEIGVLYGPHGAPDFFTQADIDQFFSTHWEVHYNSSRTGVRLIGPKPVWARADGGEAGLHPSNIHDNAYAIGAIDFTGDMPVILGPDGPSLGGFVCPATIAMAELWKVGQLRPGDTIQFTRWTQQHAQEAWLLQQQQLGQQLAQDVIHAPAAQVSDGRAIADDAILYRLAAHDDEVEVVYRRAGDDNVLIEYGELVLDLTLRFRVHALMLQLDERRASQSLPGVIDLTPGIRSLQVHYDPLQISLPTLLDQLIEAEKTLSDIDTMSVPTRTVWLPLSWDDVATRLAIEKYQQSVRADAPWCPSNIEFIRRINGLNGVDDVKRIVFEASYLVLGLGDVYLGAPVATPIDPRHRLVTTKYNPARTWTPENAVGIGGAYLCVYGMEGPGGYQFVGRTVQMWNRWRQTADFQAGKPWLLRFFDQIRFYPMDSAALLQYRQDFIAGRVQLKVEHGTFTLAHYKQFLQDNAESIQTFKQQQQGAFDAERERWRAQGVVMDAEVTVDPTATEEASDTLAGTRITSPVAGNVWQLKVALSQTVKAGDVLVVIEAMKMEMAISAPCDGTVLRLNCVEGKPVTAGQALLLLGTEE